MMAKFTPSGKALALVTRAAAMGLNAAAITLHKGVKDILSRRGTGVWYKPKNKTRKAILTQGGRLTDTGKTRVQTLQGKMDTAGTTRTGRKKQRRLHAQILSIGKAVTKKKTRRMNVRTKAGNPTRSSKPGEPPAAQQGHLRRSIQLDRATVESLLARIGTNMGKGGRRIEYAKWLELGTSRMRPRPYLRPSLKLFRPRFVGIVENTMRRVLVKVV